MEQREYRIECGIEPLLVLPLCVGALALSGRFFDWFATASEMPADGVAAFRIVYWAAFLWIGGDAVWRLMRTIYATPLGLEYRFWGRDREVFRWGEFSCAYLGRITGAKSSEIWLVPRSCGSFPDDHNGRMRFLSVNYAEMIRLQRTKNNIRAIETYFGTIIE